MHPWRARRAIACALTVARVRPCTRPQRVVKLTPMFDLTMAMALFSVETPSAEGRKKLAFGFAKKR